MKKSTIAIGLLLGLNGLILGTAKFASTMVVDTWKKGPLIDPVAPYAPENAQWLFAIGMCSALNLYLLFMFISRKSNLKKILPVLCMLLSIAITEFGLQGYLGHNQQSYFRPHPTLHWVVRSNLDEFPNLTGGGTLSTNEDGMRSAANWSSKEESTFRILVLGDSSNFGHGVSGEEMWSRQLQDILKEHGSDSVEVINGSCPGWTTYQGLEALRNRYAKYAPDLVLVGFNNDSGPDFMPDHERVGKSRFRHDINGLLYQSELYLLGREAVLSLLRRLSPTAQRAYQVRLAGEKNKYGALTENEQLKLVPRVGQKSFEANLSQFEQWATDNDARFIWINMPINRREQALVSRYVDFDYRERVSELAKSDALEMIDVDDYWLRTREPNLHIAAHLFHPNKRGHRRMAEQIAAELLQRGVVPNAKADDFTTGGPEPASNNRTLRLGYSINSPIHAHVGAILEDNPHLAQDLHLDLELYPYKSGKEQGEALRNRKLDAWFSCALPAIRMLDGRPDSRILKSLGSMGDIAVLTTKEISQLADLSGKRIGLSKGSTPEMDWKIWGQDLSDVEVVDIKTDSLDNALQNGTIDALVSWDPWVSGWLLEHPNWHVLESRPFYSVLIGTHLWSITSDQMAPRAERLVTLIERALLLAAENRETLDAEIAQKTGWPQPVIDAVSAKNNCLDGGSCKLFLDESILSNLTNAVQFAHPNQKSIDHLLGEGLLEGKAFAPPESP